MARDIKRNDKHLFKYNRGKKQAREEGAKGLKRLFKEQRERAEKQNEFWKILGKHPHLNHFFFREGVWEAEVDSEKGSLGAH